DACQAVGERHGRDVVPALSFALQGPLSEVIRGTPGTLLSMRGQECRAGGVDQQGAQRDIAPLGDATEPATFTAGVLTGSQAKPGSEGSTAWKAFDIADGSTDRGAAEQADAGDLAQLLNNRIGASEGCKVALDLLDVMLQLLDLAEHLGQQWTDRCGQLLRRLCKVVGDASARDPHSKGNCDAK